MQERQQTIEKPDSFDVMSVVICLLPDRKVIADYGVWNQAWKEISESAIGQRLIPDVYFQTVGPLFFSDEVSSVRRILGMAGIMESGSPSYKYYYLDDEGKNSVLEGQSELLEVYGDEIREMAETLHKWVRIQ